MATNIPPHNLGEVIDACQLLLRSPATSIEELIEIVPAPDFPTAGIIYGVAGVREGYRTGRGRVVMRAKTHFEEIEKGNRSAIIVDELPYQVNKRLLLERIAELVNEKKIEGISDIRDESDKSGMRVVIELKRGEVPEIVLNNLYKHTQLQDTFGINMVALVDGQPRLLNLKQMLEYFLSHRREVVTRRTVFELRKARDRGHMLEGLAVAIANVDEMIELIKASPTPPVAKERLMARDWSAGVAGEMLARAGSDLSAYKPEGLDPSWGLHDATYRLSDVQAQEILQMRLQRLTGLEQDKIVQEYREVIEQITDLLDMLARPERITVIIRDELTAIRAEFAEGKADVRRSVIELNATELDTEDLITPTDMVVTLSHSGYIKSQPLVGVPGAAARRPRQAGDGDQGGGLDRPAVHRQHARLHPVLFGPRPRLLAEGLGGAAGHAQLSRQADRQPVPAGGQTRRSPSCCRSRPSTTRTSCSWRPRWARSRRRRSPISPTRARPASSRSIWTRATT